MNPILIQKTLARIAQTTGGQITNPSMLTAQLLGGACSPSLAQAAAEATVTLSGLTDPAQNPELWNAILLQQMLSIAATGPTGATGPGAVGKQTIWIPAGSMRLRTTNGAAAGSAETTNKVMIDTLDFDSGTAEYAQFDVAMPKSWDEGTVTYQAIWCHASTTTNFGVVWSLQGLAVSDTDALDAAFGTAQDVADTGGTTDAHYVSAESSALTVGGSPAEKDTVIFQVSRKPADASDTMAVDARLIGIRLYVTTNAVNDA